jgi:hypothetical protein
VIWTINWDNRKKITVIIGNLRQSAWIRWEKNVNIVQCWGFTWSLMNPSCTCYSTKDAVRIGNFFIYNPNHTSLQSLTIIYYAVTRLHNYNPYMYVTTITYYTLALADFSLSITVSNYHTLSIFTRPVSVSYRDLTRRTAPFKLFPRTNWTGLIASLYIAELR